MNPDYATALKAALKTDSPGVSVGAFYARWAICVGAAIFLAD